MICALGATLASCSGGDKRKAPPTPEVGYVVVQTQAVSLPVTLAGRTAAFETSEVRPQVSGVIRARQFTEGAIVREGQTLYQIDPSLYQAAAEQARANVAAAEATRSAAATKAARYAPLAKIEAISQQDYTDAAAQSRQAAAQVAVGRATLDTARVNLRFTRVPAPITGRIGRSLVTTGGLVTANQTDPLTTIQRLDPMFVDIQQSSADLLALRRSLAGNGAVPATAAVKIALEDGSAYPYAGTLQFTEAMVDPTTGSVTLRVRVPNPQGLLLPGMYVRALITQASAPSAILVPQAGVTRTPRGVATVLLVGADGKAVLREITADRTIGDKWLVTAGLKPGDKVIVEGLGKAKPGAAVKAVPAGSKPSPRAAGETGTARAR
ncbi:efflux RND transporter periplasmic adaptor subunit [Sphingomonas antarctica]|uniref:efflux RND transporter periplasmic adaptor subunit n=1 Tax=Sphingomonas antarctica TaxID=2040274 RepID=UPI0039E8ED02